MAFENYVSNNPKKIVLDNGTKNLFREYNFSLYGYIRQSPAVFRGSKYNEFIKSITKYSLDKNLTSSELKEICNDIKKYFSVESDEKLKYFDTISDKEIQSLYLYLNICCEKGLYLICEK